MKTGRAQPSLDDYQVVLPPEVISVIVSFVQNFAATDLRTRTLWASCLLSRSWYSATVPHLYRSPLLANKNFDKFARTLCPPVNSHVRRIGLEAFVTHLDMGRLAYESSKSLTARLLRRTGPSLETFVAPAVSFSITCLAPLSKCRRLRSLDLSRDSYDIDLTQLLNATEGLTELTSLSLPKRIRKSSPFSSKGSGGTSWPPNLVHLQFNDHLPLYATFWDEVAISLPTSLTSISFESYRMWLPFYTMHQASNTAAQVKSLSIGIDRAEDGFPIQILLVPFPGLIELAITTPVTMPDTTFRVREIFPANSAELKQLTFRPVPGFVQPKPQLKTSFLSACAEMFPGLVRIELPEPYLEIDEESSDHLDAIEKLMNSRAKHENEETGIFLIES